MIVTIDDYRSPPERNVPINNAPPQQQDLKFTVASAGHLKLKLQALNAVLARTPPAQHHQLHLIDLLQGALPRTYVNGSEEVYFLVKGLPWPSKIPEVFAKAYGEALQSRPFTNTHVSVIKATLEHVERVSAPTFSRIRRLLPELDTLCNTTLYGFFQDADAKVKPFAFLSLPLEIRLQCYDHLVPAQAFVQVHSKKFPRVESQDRVPERLDVLRVCKALHDEAVKHFFNKPTLLIEACWKATDPRYRGMFTMETATEYASIITNISPKVTAKFTRLEIRVTPDMILPGRERMRSLNTLAQPDASPLQQICAALPNLEMLVISFSEIDSTVVTPVGMQGHPLMLSYCHNQKSALEWIRTELSENRLRIAWDLLHFRHWSKNAAQLRKDIMSERIMRELVERDGSLEIVQSATVNRENSQKWSEFQRIVLDAVKG